jgi:hypothetical protein
MEEKKGSPYHKCTKDDGNENSYLTTVIISTAKQTL